jgi:hypothetical protein
MNRRCIALALVVVLAAPFQAGAAYELLTWATTAAAPADGSPYSASASYEMVSRLGGPFVGRAESASFALWGCSVTPVEGAFFATETEPLCVTLRWTIESLADLDGLNVYRATSEDGPFSRVNEHVLPPDSPGVYEDRTVWPGSTFWYELRGVLVDGTEDVVGDPVMLTTGGHLDTKLYTAAPNPFSDVTSIQLDVLSASGGVELIIYDIAGRVVRHLEMGVTGRGRHTVSWDGTNDNGQRAASGVYFCALEADGTRQTTRIVYLR